VGTSNHENSRIAGDCLSLHTICLGGRFPGHTFRRSSQRESESQVLQSVLGRSGCSTLSFPLQHRI
jgi:hypothetical protein